MNDLTKEAIRRQQQDWEIDIKTYMANAGYSSGRSSAQSNIDQSYGRPKYGNDYLEPDRPLTGRPVHYLTDLEDSKCVRLDAPLTGAYNEGYLDGFETGAEEESRTGINPDKINRVSDDYRKISDEVEQEIGE